MIIRKLRLQRGWSQDDLAQLTGLSVRTIQRIEKGQKAGLESLKALAAVFEVELTDLQQEPDMQNSSSFPHGQYNVTAEERLALEHVRRKRGFYRHAISYAAVIPVLWGINLFSSEHIWAIWPTLGWGIGLLSHAMRVFPVIHLFGPQWEKREVEKILNRKL